MKQTLINLSNSVFIGNCRTAADYASSELEKYCDRVETDLTGSIFGYFDNGAEKTIMLEAHIDEIGLTVTNILDKGFLRVNKVGGVDIRTLPASAVTIHGKKDICGIFSSTPPHLSKDKNKEFSDLDELLVDTGITNIGEIVSVGDFASFDVKAAELENGYISGKSIDNRSGCTVMLELAKRLNANRDKSFNIIILLASGEELGNRGAKIGGFDKNVDMAIAVDVSFARSPMAPSEKCGECEKGAMIGVSPILDKPMRDALISIAEKNKIPYQLEAMNGLTSTDADVLTVTQSGIRTALISIPLKYMHTPVETVYLDDIKSVCDLIFDFVKEGNKNA